MNNDFETEYSCWPFRYYVIANNKIKYIAYPEDSTFDICELFKFLKEY